MQRSLSRYFTTAICLFVCFSVFFGGVYPLLIYGIGQFFFAREANGALLSRANGSIIGATLIGQRFVQDKYFHPRPSLGDYNAAHSLGGQFGPTSKVLIDVVQHRIEVYRQNNALPMRVAVPIDAVTASGSGLDPHISIQNAHLQSGRVAAARGLSVEYVQQLIKACTEKPMWGLFGEERINVLLINLYFDSIQF